MPFTLRSCSGVALSPVIRKGLSLAAGTGVACLLLQPGSTKAYAQVQGRDGITLPAPPVVQPQPVTDEYPSAGSPTPVKVVDPYRWLEDAHSPETRAFISDENAYTEKYFSQVKMLPTAEEQLTKLLKVDTVSVPAERGELYFYSKRLASENQASLYVRKGLHGDDRKLVDGNTLSADGNTSVNLVGLTQDGAVMTYGIRVGGADELEVHFMDVSSGKEMYQTLPSARYYGVDIAPHRNIKKK